VLYSSQKSPRRSRIDMIKDTQNPPIPEAINEHSNTTDAERISALEEEVKRLKQALVNHAVKDYLAELREESWREISSEVALKEVERRVSKKL
jgi:hypothetical protein